MSTILIVDDNPGKYASLLKLAEGTLLRAEDIVVAGCIREALEKLRSRQFDVLVVDMLLPETPWGDPVDDGGARLLQHIEEDEELKRPKYIIGITAAADAGVAEAAFATKPWILLKTAGGGNPWERQLLSLIQHAIQSERAQDAARYKTDACIITALKHPEFEALGRAGIDLGEPILIDSATYVQTGTLQTPQGTLSIVAGCCLRMGSTESALLAAKLIEKFRPRILALVGICAGYEDKVAYGDVIVASPCWDYTSAKVTVTPEGVKTVANSPDFISVDLEVASRFDQLNGDRGFLSRLHEEWPGDKPRGAPQIHVGPSATGPAVVADAQVFAEIRKNQQRTTIGLEMEAYGVYCAARMSTRPRPIVFSAKAVCDYANFLKDDKYQKYAAFTSAVSVVEFLRRYGRELVLSMD